MEKLKSNEKNGKNNKAETTTTEPANVPENGKTEVSKLARKLLDEKLEKIQRFSGMQTRLATLRATLLKLQEFKFTSTRNNDILILKDGAEYNNEFKTSNLTYVEKVRDFIISELKRDIEATEIEIESATL